MPNTQTLPLPLTVALLCIASMVLMGSDVELPDQAPIPSWRDEALRRNDAATAVPKAEMSCRKELRGLDVEFTAAPAVEVKEGCSLPFPLEVTALGPGIELRPPAVMSCSTARAAARLFQGPAMAAAKKYFDARISTVRQASGYVCRNINGSTNISQHAFGNALDVSAITLSGGQQIVISPRTDADTAEARFQKAVRKAACGIFSTVLGPGTNADHDNHFHFDVKRRRAPYCR